MGIRYPRARLNYPIQNAIINALATRNNYVAVISRSISLKRGLNVSVHPFSPVLLFLFTFSVISCTFFSLRLEFIPQVGALSVKSELPTVRIAFLLTLNGRAVRQVHRLLKLLYGEEHYYFIHVDSVSL